MEDQRRKCWEIVQCKQMDCPLYHSQELHCWLAENTKCRDQTRKNFLEKLDLCLQCTVFSQNMNSEAMNMSFQAIAREVLATREAIEARDRELESTSMEMAIGMSEVFEALKRIASGDPEVRMPVDSSIELISKLKEIVNKTAENLSEIIDLSHEFAIGLAEHFDVLHRVSKGDLAARVMGSSDVELLDSFKNVTNQMIQSVDREIIERRQVEEQLRRSEEKFRTFAEKAPIGITIMNANRHFEYINPTFTEIFGYTYEDLPDKDAWFEKAYPDPVYRQRVKAKWEKYVYQTNQPGEIKHRDLTVTCKNQTRKIVSFRTVVLKTGKHFVTYADITDRAQAQEAIRQSEEKYRTLIDNIQDGVFIIQEDKFIFVNEAFAKIVGFTVEEVIGTDLVNVIAPEDLDIFADRYLRRQAGETVQREYEFRMLHKDGSTRIYVNINFDTLTYRDKISTIGTVKNITDQRIAEEEKQKLEARLQRSQKMEAIGTLAGGVAHDLNNILSGIVSYPELILMNLDASSPLIKPIMTIKKAGERASAIVLDLLTLARRGVATTEIIDLNQIVTEYLKTPEYNLLYSFHPQIILKTDLADDLLKIIGSSVHLSKTVMNLIANAAEAMPNGGQITVTTRNRYIDKPIRGYDDVREGDFAVLSISDSGVGIFPEDMEQIFEPFYTRKVMGRSGTGLGMAVVWGTVKDHRGYIDVQSIPGKGTNIKLYFPVTRKTLPDQMMQTDHKHYRGRGETILIVDDIKEQRAIASAILKELGYSVTSVAQGEDAIAYLKTHSVDLIVLDMIMEPGIDGLETYRTIIEFKPGQKAIIASGFSETRRVKAAQRLGAGEYVKKPYTIEKIGMAVRRELNR
jgi:two-component system cell cycle sensor histidine kinase/response regulator CckA